jgi:hypothetical protein
VDPKTGTWQYTDKSLGAGVQVGPNGATLLSRDPTDVSSLFLLTPCRATLKSEDGGLTCSMRVWQNTQSLCNKTALKVHMHLSKRAALKADICLDPSRSFFAAVLVPF